MSESAAYVLTNGDLRELADLDNGLETPVSLDLGISTSSVRMTDDRLTLPDGSSVARSDLAEFADKKGRIFAVRAGDIRALEVVGEHFCKLAPTVGAPTIEIDGIQMHRTKGIDPFEDARQKADGTVRRGDVVLDTCGGLGYSAIWAAKLGASGVVSVEVSPAVRELREQNPWSRALLDPSIVRVDGDVREFIVTADDESFHSIIHDPPRFSLAGELYGGEFYAQLARVLRPRGRLFHYTGAPQSRSGRRDLPREVTTRLREVGLTVRQEPEKQGVSARK